MKFPMAVACMAVVVMAPAVVPGYVTTFTPSLSVTREYSDNLRLAERNREQDSITTVSPGVEMGIRHRHSGLGVAYVPGFSWYDRYSENDTVRQSADLSVWHGFSEKTRLELTDRFRKTEEPLSEGDNTSRKSRDHYYSNSASLGLTHRFGARDVVRAGYSHNLLENDDETLEDNSGNTGQLGLNMMVSDRVDIEADIEHTRVTYDVSDDVRSTSGRLRLLNLLKRNLYGFVEYAHQDVDYRGDEREDYKVYHPSAGVRYAWDDQSAFTVNAGYYIQDRAVSSDEEGVLVSGDIEKTWLVKPMTILVSGTAGYEEAFLDAENRGFDLYYEGEVSVSRAAGRHVRLGIVTSFRSDDYVNPAPGEPDREDRRYTAGAGLAWQAKQWLSLKLDYAYRKLDSTVDENDYEENSGRFTVVLTGQSGFRSGGGDEP